jgi:ComF family protein
VLDLLVPRRCVVCRRPGAQLCPACRAALPRIEPPLCERCGAPTEWPVSRCRECAGRRLAFASARAVLVYDEAVKRLVSGWKERGLRGLAAGAATLIADGLPAPEADAIAFVPADGDRGAWRGHNPAEALAVDLGRLWELPVESLLRRTRTLQRQRGLTLTERRGNVRGAFRSTAAAPARVCLVDDVYTSGSTVAAAATVLRSAGARTVAVVTLARAVR